MIKVIANPNIIDNDSNSVTAGTATITEAVNRDTPSITVNKLCASWTNDKDKLTLYDITFTLNKVS